METQWPLVIFALLSTFSSGVLGLLGVLIFLGKGKSISLIATITALVALVIGGIASFAHLQQWSRAFNGFANIGSGITQELIGLLLCAIVLVIILVLSRRKEIPKWAGILAVIVSLLMVFLLANAYMMPARPLWSTPLLFVFYYAVAIAAGGAGMWLFGTLKKSDAEEQVLCARVTAIGGALLVIALVAYGAFANTVVFSSIGFYFDPITPTEDMVSASDLSANLFTGSLAVYFWVAICASAIAAILGFLKWKNSGNAIAFALVALIAVLGSGLVFRVVLYMIGASVFMFY